MIDINGSLIIQIVNFLFIMIVLNYLLYKPIRGILQERREKFAAYESEIKGMTEEADSRLQDFQAKLAEARREGFLKKDEIKGQGLAEEKAILDSASQEAEDEVGKIKNQIKSEIAAARDSLKADIDMFSEELAQKVLGRSLS